MIVKVKELHQPQFNRMRKGQILFAFLHLAADRPLASALMEKRVSGGGLQDRTHIRRCVPTASANERDRGLHVGLGGCGLSRKSIGGRGILLAGAPGVARGNMVILGQGWSEIARTELPSASARASPS